MSASIAGGPAGFEIVTLVDADVARLFEVSRARAASVCVELFARVVVSQPIVYGGVVTSAPNATPSTRNCTPATPTLSVALATRLTVPLTVAPLAGEVSATVGGVLSFDTVTVTAAEVVTLPAASRATAVSVCAPLLAVGVLQASEYDA